LKQTSSSVQSKGLALGIHKKARHDTRYETLVRQTYDQRVQTVLWRHPSATSSSLLDDLARNITCSIIGSRLDYCSSPLTGTSKSNLIKPQRVQNTLSRVAVRQGKFDRIKPVVKELHWLSIKKHMTFKLATLSYNIRSTGQPVYLCELLSDYQPVCTLRSFSKYVFNCECC